MSNALQELRPQTAFAGNGQRSTAENRLPAPNPVKSRSLTPFVMPEYQLQAREDENRLDAEAELSAAAVRRDIQRSTNYVLAVVLFAAALFFAGMSAKLATPRLRRAMLALGLILFVGTVAWLATFPVSVSV